MDVLIYLIPIALVLGGVALASFLWALKSGQFDDMEGAANRILFDDDAPEQTPEKPNTEKPNNGDKGN